MKFRTLAAVGVLAFVGSAVAQQHRVLAIVYSQGFQDQPGILNLRASLQATGATVDWLNNAQQGQLAQRLANNTYDSIFLYDITTAAIFGGQDGPALNNWFNAQTKSVVMDGRSYGSFFQGGPNTPDDLFLRNIALNFRDNGGGLWLGADDSPSWTQNANRAATAVGLNQFSQLVSEPIIAGQGPYVTTPNNINPLNLNWGWSASYAPTGVQPNGAVLERILWGRQGTLASGNLVPTPGATAILALGGLAAARRRR